MLAGGEDLFEYFQRSKRLESLLSAFITDPLRVKPSFVFVRSCEMKAHERQGESARRDTTLIFALLWQKCLCTPSAHKPHATLQPLRVATPPANPHGAHHATIMATRLLWWTCLAVIAAHACLGHARPPSSATLPHSTYRAVTVLYAPCNTLAFTLANFAGNLGAEWQLAVFHNDALTDFITSTKLARQLMDDGRLSAVPLRRHGFSTLSSSNTDDYSSLLTSPAFWRFLNADHVLIFQTDSVLCSLSPWSVHDFLEYDYVGAPRQGSHNDDNIGSGGLSLRKVETMLHITDTFPPSLDENEDAYFARCFGMMQRSGKRVHLPSPHTAASFAYETGMPPDLASFGVHKLGAVRWGPGSARHVTPYAETVGATCPEIVAGVLLSCNVSEYREGEVDLIDVFLAAPSLRME